MYKPMLLYSFGMEAGCGTKGKIFKDSMGFCVVLQLPLREDWTCTQHVDGPETVIGGNPHSSQPISGIKDGPS